MSERIAVLCRTKELSHKVQEKSFAEGRYWCSSGEGLKDYYGECEYFLIEENEISRTCSPSSAYTIISAEEYLREEEVFKVGDRVECIGISGITEKYSKAIVKLGHKYIVSHIFNNGTCGIEEAESCVEKIDFKLTTKQTKTKKENKSMEIGKSFIKVFKSDAELALKMSDRFGAQYSNSDRDQIALERDKKQLLSIVEAEDEAAEAKKD